MRCRRWKIPHQETVIPRALTDAGCTPLLAAVLYARGVTEPDRLPVFLSGDTELLGDPWLLPDMDKAVSRLRRAIEVRERVAVYGDYDVDGITASCLMTGYLREKGLDCRLYIPDRMEEGYGLNSGAMDTLRADGVTLIVTVDCGVTAVEETAYAASLGMEMIITDHHQCRERLPAALAVVNPKRPDCAYPNPECLAGVGVAFKLLCALEGDSEAVLDRWSDLVALGTVADIMPMLGENRCIVRRGMAKLRTAPRPGLRALIVAAGVENKLLSASTVGFSLAPRINAAGRLGSVDKAVDLLLTDDPEQAERLAGELCDLNRRRQALEQEVWQESVDVLGEQVPETPLVLASDHWHQGVIGIAASKLTDKYGVPAVMVCFDGDLGKGSCRSVPGFNLFDALSACAEHLVSFGGHALAAGLNIRREALEPFRAALGDYYRAHPPTEPPTLYADLCIDRPGLLDLENVQSLEQLEPCGNGNPRPLVCITDALLEALVPIGGGRSLRMNIRKFGQNYEAVFFGHTAQELGLAPGDRVDLVFGPQVNEFRGRRSVQLMVTDIRKNDALPLCRRLLRGEDPLPREVWSIYPRRGDFARIWRSLDFMGGAEDIPLAELSERLCPPMHPGKISACLAVFRELGLLELQTEDDRVDIILSAPGKKVDLNSSQVLGRLARLRPEGIDRG